MSIAFVCACGKSLRAKDDFAGKKTKCPHCGAIQTIPAQAPPPDPNPESAPPADDEIVGYLFEGAPTPSHGETAPESEDRFAAGSRTASSAFVPSLANRESQSSRPIVKPKAKADGAGGSILEYSYLLLVFALIPLMFSLLGKESKTVTDRLEATLEHATPEQANRIEAALAKGDGLTKEELFAVLPEGKLEGAHLSHDSVLHWVYAVIAAVGFLLLVLLMFSVERSNPLHLLGIGLFTGTIGIIFLFIVQFCSQIRLGAIRGRGVFMVIMLILALIGWSYRSALDADSNFFLSAVGFTFGVGFCEELTKAIPVLFYFKRDAAMGWRGACLWGLASGIGFGVSEGIMYSADSYNGITGVDLYVVRFVSCVALHAMWSAAGAIAIARTVDAYEAVGDWSAFGLYLLRVLAVPMVLHGFYDTLLKKDMDVWALVTAIASFAWFAIQIERARGAMPGPGEWRKNRRFA
jgi:RsiW-degrading membrane proteinase PrsW (M82 family)